MPEPLDLPTELPVGADPVPISVPLGLSDFARGILDTIPEPDRPVMSKYLTTWDKDVNDRFANIHKEYEPYKALGSVEDLQEMTQWMTLLNNDPQAFVQRVQQAMEEIGMTDTGQQGYQQDPQPYSNLPEFEGVPQQFVERYTNLENKFEQFMESVQGFIGQTTEQQQMQQVDNLLKNLHNAHGDFDDDYILMKLSQGNSPEDSVKAFKETIGKFSSSKTPPPTIMSGPGSVPSGQVDFSKMTHDERKRAAVQMLKAAHAS